VIYAGWYTLTVVYGVNAMTFNAFRPDFSS